jgi:hypothetical protein
MSTFIADVFDGIDEIEPLSDIFDRQEAALLKNIKPKNLKKAKKLISLYSLSHTPFHIFKQTHKTLEIYKKEIDNFLKQRETDLMKIISEIK